MQDLEVNIEENDSQNSISSTFGRKTAHNYVKIGSTLDDLYYGRIQITDIPKITVVKKDDKWFTTGNRRLWIFHHLEGAGKCSEIEVIEDTVLPHFTTTNGGTSVTIFRGNDPGGQCRGDRSITPVTPTRIEIESQRTSLQSGKEESRDADDTRPEGAELCGVNKSEDPSPDFCLNQSHVINSSTYAQPVTESSSEPKNDLVDQEITDTIKSDPEITKPKDTIQEITEPKNDLVDQDITDTIKSDPEIKKPKDTIQEITDTRKSDPEITKPKDTIVDKEDEGLESDSGSDIITRENEDESSESKPGSLIGVSENGDKGFESKPGGITDDVVGEDEKLKPGFITGVRVDESNGFESKLGITTYTGERKNKGFEPKPGISTYIGEREDKGFGSKLGGITNVREKEDGSFESKPCAINGENGENVLVADTEANDRKSLLSVKRSLDSEDVKMEEPKRIKVDSSN